ncbi:MAG: DUF4166 domain-containing protein [Halobacteria archaeon]|nr:DUF4166 domain-containing protein [Halobacteria archaeon]
MKSIYHRALGDRFHSLHPRLQERYGITSASGEFYVGTGEMEYVRTNGYVSPLLRLGARRNLVLPESGEGVEFEIRNYAYEDSLGRETVSGIREFVLDTQRRFDSYMVYSKERGGVVDYLGTHQNVAVDLYFTVDENGNLHISSEEGRFYTPYFGFGIPRALSTDARVSEYYDDTDDVFRVHVEIRNPAMGTVLEYEGSFEGEVRERNANEDIPREYLPKRLENRV